MATPSKIIYVNFNECAGAGMFRRRLDGIRRYAKARGMEVARLGRDDCAVEKVPEALARLRPMGCVVEPPFLRPGFFRRFPSVYFDVPRMPKWRSITASVRCDETAVAEASPPRTAPNGWTRRGGCRWEESPTRGHCSQMTIATIVHKSQISMRMLPM